MSDNLTALQRQRQINAAQRVIITNMANEIVELSRKKKGPHDGPMITTLFGQPFEYWLELERKVNP